MLSLFHIGLIVSPASRGSFAMPSAPPHTVIEVYTPFFVGTFLNIFLYGIAVTQMYTYYRTSKNDKLWMRLLILYLFVLETVNSFVDIGLVFEPLLLNFGNKDVIATSPWSERQVHCLDEDLILTFVPVLLALRLDGVTTALISTPVQIFMAYRIHVIMETVIPTVIVSMLAISSLSAYPCRYTQSSHILIGLLYKAGSVWLAISVSQSPQYEKFNDIRAAPSLWLISSAVADIAIACCLVYGLSKKRTGFAVLNDQIDRIIRGTGRPDRISYCSYCPYRCDRFSERSEHYNARNIFPHFTGDIDVFCRFFTWDLMLSKLYTTTLLSSLNARASARSVERAKHNEPNALFSSDTASVTQQATFNAARASRHNTHHAPKISGDYNGSYELSSRVISTPRRDQDRAVHIRDPSAQTEFSVGVVVSQSTITDGERDSAKLFPQSKPFH
ncbi:hypothetical protein D9757_009766 [Collybiopsis confluens]|uniref:DUF6534 domain-containing protein n=1 Tax=Collybiopsis confluens TaxID=2823264 RepID=A0A8H5LXW2_9AGAR|nr:hypothetical protein D9757_009766 [Collybiopsis confluens]